MFRCYEAEMALLSRRRGLSLELCSKPRLELHCGSRQQSEIPESAGLNLVEACHGYRAKSELEDELIQFN
jgi:hypothetical protein